jgi:hypothetical protein
MLLSGKSQIIDFQMPSDNTFTGNKARVKRPENRQVFSRFTIKFILATMAFVGIGFGGIIFLEKILQPGVTIAGSNRSGCNHQDGCFPTPENY